MYWLTAAAPAKCTVALPANRMIKITAHPRQGFKLYTRAENRFSLFRRPTRTTSGFQKDLFVTIFNLPELSSDFSNLSANLFTHSVTLNISFLKRARGGIPNNTSTAVLIISCGRHEKCESKHYVCDSSCQQSASCPVYLLKNKKGILDSFSM
jgi:hypothetical protein